MHVVARRICRHGAVLFVVLLLSACYSARYASPRELPIQLYAKTGFQLQRPPTTGTSGSVACTVVRTRARVQAIRGDTLYLSHVEPLKRPYGAPECPELEAAMVVTSSYPDLRAERTGVTGPETKASVLLLTPVLMLGAALVLLAISIGISD